MITSPLPGASTGAGQIPVTWTAAVPNGSPVTQYQVAAVPAGAGDVTTVTCTAPFSGSPCMLNPDLSISATLDGLSNCQAYDLTVTAISAGGSTPSAPVQGVTPRAAPSVPSLPGSPLEKVAGAVGELRFSWSASAANGCGPVAYTVELTPPAGFQCGDPGSSPCLLPAGAETSYLMSTTIPACPFPSSVDCADPRTWRFRVRASNDGGTSGFSAAVAGTPRIGYGRDTIWRVWEGCTGCHSASNVLNLRDDADTTHATSWNALRNTAGVVVVPSPAMSLIHLCPTRSAGCSAHSGGTNYAAGSQEDNLVVQWILDGALF